MEGIKGSIEALTQSFTQRMATFESELKKTTTPQQTTLSSLSSEFEMFRQFVLATLKNLEQQLALLVADCDNVEMRSRRAMLLFHGVPEEKDEAPVETVLRISSQHLATSVKIGSSDIIRVSRLGKARTDKPRPLLIKFQSETLRDKLWSAKSKFKGAGITMLEFLTKMRHTVFVAARQRSGVSNCWTSAGRIVAVGGDGKRHRISSMGDIDRIAELATGTSPAKPRKEPQPSATVASRKRAASAKRK